MVGVEDGRLTSFYIAARDGTTSAAWASSLVTPVWTQTQRSFARHARTRSNSPPSCYLWLSDHEVFAGSRGSSAGIYASRRQPVFARTANTPAQRKRQTSTLSSASSGAGHSSPSSTWTSASQPSLCGSSSGIGTSASLCFCYRARLNLGDR